MSLLGLWRRFGRPRNSNHSNVSRVEKRCFLAFGCDFQWKKCLGHRRIRGFDFCENAETLYSTYQNELFSLSLSAKCMKKLDFRWKTCALIRKTCFRGVKSRVLGTLFSMRIDKKGLTAALARVFGGSKSAQKSPKWLKLRKSCSRSSFWPSKGYF